MYASAGQRGAPRLGGQVSGAPIGSTAPDQNWFRAQKAPGQGGTRLRGKGWARLHLGRLSAGDNQTRRVGSVKRTGGQEVAPTVGCGCGASGQAARDRLSRTSSNSRALISLRIADNPVQRLAEVRQAVLLFRPLSRPSACRSSWSSQPPYAVAVVFMASKSRAMLARNIIG